MIQSFISYLILISSMYFLSKRYTKIYHNKPIEFRNPYILSILVIYTIFTAIRFNVGFDYESYYYDYIYCKRYTTYESLETEPLWSYFTWYFRNSNIHYTLYFGLISLLQICFVIKAFKNEAYLLPALILSFFLNTSFINFQNVLRQNIVMALFLYIVMRKRNMNFIFLSAIVAFCMLIHKSSFIILLLYPLYKINLRITKHNKILFWGFILCVIVGYLVDIFSRLASSEFVLMQIATSDYSVYASDEFLKMGTGKSSGMGFLLKVVLDGIVIWNCSQVHDYFNKDKGYDIYFQIYYIGTCLHYLIPSSMVFGRPILYLTIFSLPVVTYYIYYIKQTITMRATPKNVINTMWISLLILLFFANYFLNAEGFKSEYHYFWENPEVIL